MLPSFATQLERFRGGAVPPCVVTRYCQLSIVPVQRRRHVTSLSPSPCLHPGTCSSFTPRGSTLSTGWRRQETSPSKSSSWAERTPPAPCLWVWLLLAVQLAAVCLFTSDLKWLLALGFQETLSFFCRYFQAQLLWCRYECEPAVNDFVI